MPTAPVPDWREHVERVRPPAGVLMCPPDHFEVVDEKNVFMRGQQGRIDRERARSQWEGLAATYRHLGVEVSLLPARAGCEDMVFCANGACLLPRAAGGAVAVLSRMNHASRRREVPVVAETLGSLGYGTVTLPDDVGTLEGHGDVLTVPGRRLALGGFGGRSELAALEAVERLTGHALVALPLVGDVFYHLDTALAVLDERSALLHPPAFEPPALDALAVLFERLVEADPHEAEQHLACNAHALADGHVLLPAQAARTAERLADAGYTPVPVDVSEFHKSGGSVFCMRMDLPDLRPL